MHYYHVYSGSKHIDLVKASTPEDACRKVYAKFGAAGQYTNDKKDYCAINYCAIKA